MVTLLEYGQVVIGNDAESEALEPAPAVEPTPFDKPQESAAEV